MLECLLCFDCLFSKAASRTAPVKDTSQDVKNIEGSRTNGITTIKFRRKKTTVDTNDFQFSDSNCPYFLYAKGGTYDDIPQTFTKHTYSPVASTAKICVICKSKCKIINCHSYSLNDM